MSIVLREILLCSK